MVAHDSPPRQVVCVAVCSCRACSVDLKLLTGVRRAGVHDAAAAVLHAHAGAAEEAGC
jgi:hypothetical protein